MTLAKLGIMGALPANRDIDVSPGLLIDEVLDLAKAADGRLNAPSPSSPPVRIFRRSYSVIWPLHSDYALFYIVQRMTRIGDSIILGAVRNGN
jgi:hypothetical protein